MKTTGVIRRIDDLGRIVIPKEIRKTMRIKNGESLEIYLDEENIILKKYSPIESLETIASKYVETFNKVLKHNVIVTDKDRVIAIAGNLKKRYEGKEISDFVDRGIERRESFVERQKKSFEIVKGEEEFGYYAFSSIVSNSDTLGSVIIVSTEIPILDSEEKMASILANLLGNSFVE